MQQQTPMYVKKEYNRRNAQEYALEWALSRNPLFHNYTDIGGDCTNFVSQCLYAGSCEMNYTPVFGWYYMDSDNRTASWTGVEFLYNFLTQNTGAGPYGALMNRGQLELGDVIQLGNRNGMFYHTLVVTGFLPRTYLVSAHTDDARNRPLNTYRFHRARFIHIQGVRVEMKSAGDCFPDLITGTALH
jgi:hypothetical protein